MMLWASVRAASRKPATAWVQNLGHAVRAGGGGDLGFEFPGDVAQVGFREERAALGPAGLQAGQGGGPTAGPGAGRIAAVFVPEPAMGLRASGSRSGGAGDADPATLSGFRFAQDGHCRAVADAYAVLEQACPGLRISKKCADPQAQEKYNQKFSGVYATIQTHSDTVPSYLAGVRPILDWNIHNLR